MRFQAGAGSNPVSPTICKRLEMVSFQAFFVAHPCPFSRPRLPPLFPFRCQQPHAGHFEGEGEQNAHHAHRRRWRMRARRGPFGRKHASQSPSPRTLATPPAERSRRENRLRSPSARLCPDMVPRKTTAADRKTGGLVGCAGNTHDGKESRHQPTSACSFWTQFLNCVHFIVAPD